MGLAAVWVTWLLGFGVSFFIFSWREANVPQP